MPMTRIAVNRRPATTASPRVPGSALTVVAAPTGLLAQTEQTCRRRNGIRRVGSGR